MSRYLYLYKGPATPMEQFTPEQAAEQTKAWGDWMNGIGTALVDPGAPFAERGALGDDGTSRTPSDQNGYSIVQADSLEEAQTLLNGHPFLTEGKGRFTVEVFELAPMPM